MRHRMTKLGDLRVWVEDHAGEYLSSCEIDTIAANITARDDCPRWGTDWTEFLAALPDLVTLTVDAATTEECESCHGYGHFREDGEPSEDRRDRKCLDCTGTGKVPAPK
jgi:hypothetical protein